MKKKIYFILLISGFAVASFAQSILKNNRHEGFVFSENITSSDYISKTIIFKVKQEFRSSCRLNEINNDVLQVVMNSLNVAELNKKFPHHTPPITSANNRNEKNTDISLIYEMKYINDISLEKAINALYSTGIIVYAEPHYLHKLLYTPNDPLINSQYYLNTIKAYQAWDIIQGDTNIVIGIIDTGTDLTHLDLIKNIKYNWEDPIDGVDNDNDGYIDNFYGWDMGENDCTPQVNIIKHGIHVSGIAAASVNNGTGIAGVGFKTKFLPIKVTDETGAFTQCYESIVYAVDHGCNILNCSWGRVGAYSQFEQEIINYATINNNVLVVAACGNSNSEIIFYPASYNYVLSVAATNNLDHKWTESSNGSSFGMNVDISAPGEAIFSTWEDGGYISSSGTSMAAPVVAACAALVKTQFPFYNAIQIGEQLKVTADNIDTIPVNAQYAGKLGSGRVNLFRALTTFNKPSIRMTSQNYTEKDYGNFSKNDTLHIYGDFTNYLAPTTNLSVTLTSLSPYAKIIDSTAHLGAIATLGIKNNSADPFDIVLSPVILLNQKISFKLTFKDGTYSAIQYFSFNINVDYLIIDTNKIAATITSKGRLGYNDNDFQQGIGFTYNNGASLISCGGLLLGNSSNQISDVIYSASGDLNIFDEDFCSKINAKKVIPPIFSDFDIYGVFNDDCAGANKLNVEITHKVFAWNDLQNSKYIILEYTIKNKGTSSLSSLYAGYYVDGDIKNSMKNCAALDAIDKMGYTYSNEGGTYLGIKLLSSGTFRYYAFDNDGKNLSIKISDGFTGSEKFQALKNNRNDAGNFYPGNDVSNLVSTGPFNLIAEDSIKISFALIAGDHLADLKASASASQQKYCVINEINESLQTLSDVILLQNSPNPFHNESSINFILNKNTNVELNVYDVLGKKIKTIICKSLSVGMHSVKINSCDYKTGMYYYHLTAGDTSIVKKMIIY